MNEHLTTLEKKDLEEQIPLGKIGKTEDIAKCVKWLIEDSYTTGQIISINRRLGNLKIKKEKSQKKSNKTNSLHMI